MNGAEHIRSTDSASLGEFRIEWTDRTATLHTPQSSPKKVIATFSMDQQWTERSGGGDK